MDNWLAWAAFAAIGLFLLMILVAICHNPEPWDTDE